MFKMADHLLTSQYDHYNRVKSILRTYSTYIDTSPTGAGKTYVACILAKELGYRLFVVAPKSTLYNWEKVSTEIGTSLIKAITYDGFRGSNRKITQHGFLYIDKDGTFRPTKELTDTSDILYIFDESHKLKNYDTSSRRAATVLSQNMNEGSRMGLLSGSPADKSEHFISYLFCIGIVKKHDECYKWDPATKRYTQTGSREIVEYARWLDRGEKYMRIPTSSEFGKSTVTKICEDIYRNLILRFQSSAAPLPEDIVSVDGAHLFVQFSPEEMSHIKSAVANMRALKYRDRNGRIQIDFRKLNLELRNLERAKLSKMVDIAYNTLTNVKNSKVILFLNYIDNIEDAAAEMEDYGYKSSILMGNTPSQDRDRIQKRFSETNSKLRVIISNPSVGGIGINLDDTDGRFPRYVYLAPSYKFIDILRAIGRVQRASTKSKPYARLVYSGDGERKILRSISEKSNTTKSSRYQEGWNMPSDYPEMESTEDSLCRYIDIE